MDVSELSTPALIVFEEKVKRNADKMKQNCLQYGVKLRPHFKTSKVVEGWKLLIRLIHGYHSEHDYTVLYRTYRTNRKALKREVAELQTDGTKRGLVVSTIPEAEVLAENGFDDILYAFPFQNDQTKLKRCLALTEKLSEFHIMVEKFEMIDALIKTPMTNGKKWSVFIFLDCGYHRAGVLYNSDELVRIAKALHESDRIILQGLYTHCGQSYYATNTKDVHNTAESIITNLLATVERLKSIGIECKHYGLGSTPTCSQPSEIMKKVTEWHPGNYIFYDMQQYLLGSCEKDDIACMVATRVVGHYGEDDCNHMLIDCGWTALTTQGFDKAQKGGYGAINDHPELKLESMTQEMGKVTTVDGSPVDFAKHPLGSMLFILPYHSCATCCMHPVYYVADSEMKIVNKWFPVRGW